MVPEHQFSPRKLSCEFDSEASTQLELGGFFGLLHLFSVRWRDERIVIAWIRETASSLDQKEHPTPPRATYYPHSPSPLALCLRKRDRCRNGRTRAETSKQRSAYMVAQV